MYECSARTGLRVADHAFSIGKELAEQVVAQDQERFRSRLKEVRWIRPQARYFVLTVRQLGIRDGGVIMVHNYPVALWVKDAMDQEPKM
jgi:hypothetical protein